MIRATILFEDGFAETHFAFSPDCDNAICGQDLSGDDRAEEYGTYGINEIVSYKNKYYNNKGEFPVLLTAVIWFTAVLGGYAVYKMIRR